MTDTLKMPPTAPFCSLRNRIFREGREMWTCPDHGVVYVINFHNAGFEFTACPKCVEKKYGEIKPAEPEPDECNYRWLSSQCGKQGFAECPYCGKSMCLDHMINGACLSCTRKRQETGCEGYDRCY